MRKVATVLSMALAGLLPTADLGADESAGTGPAPWIREVHNSLGASLNPLGLQDAVDLSWKRPIFDSQEAILSEAHVAFGLSEKLTPAYDRVGAWVEVSPLSVLDLRAGIEPVAYFGTFKSLLYFPGYDARFDDEARQARSGEAAFGLAGRLYVSPTLKAKAGRVVAVAGADFEWWKAEKKEGYFYEPARDTLLKASGDSMMTSQALLLFDVSREARGALRVGLVHDLTWVYAAPNNRKQDAGLAVAWALGAKRLGLLQPTLFGKAVYYVEDPWRNHQAGLQLALAFGVGH